MTLKLRHRILQRGFLAYSRLSRGMTLGVRAMLLSGGAVVLVRHTYMPGWYLPGGGVEAGETLGEALAREIGEEAGAVLTGPAQLFAIYRNTQADRRDHVGLFVCREWERSLHSKIPNREILASELFPLTALPEGTTPATRARLREVLAGERPTADW
jgi:ADP-ribose pyrophosphatase YjhB (NUDIX family)